MGEKQIDQALVARALAGNKASFNIIVLKYQHRVAKLITRMIGDRNLALDLTQETFIKAYRALDGFKGESSLYTWIYRIAVNTTKNFLKSKHYSPPDRDIEFGQAELTLVKTRLSDPDTPELMALGNELEIRVISAVHQLPSVLKTSILLREMRGLSYEDIAKHMRCPIGTVRSRIARARLVLGTLISKQS